MTHSSNIVDHNVPIVYSFDIGKVLAKEEVEIHSDMYREELSAQLSNIGANLIIKVLRDLDSYKANSVSQSNDGVTKGNFR